MEYYKLGNQANYFFDIASRISIPRGRIVAIKKRPTSGYFRSAVRSGHIVKVPEAEYLFSKGIKPAPKVEEPIKAAEVTKVTESTLPDLKSMTKAEILGHYSWFDEDDLKVAWSQRTKKDLIKFVLEAVKEYSE